MLVQARTGSADQGPIPTLIGDTYDRWPDGAGGLAMKER
jgi:hypothetical protein